MTTVFLVDDHEIARRGIADLINAERDLEVVGESATVGQTLARVSATNPDVVVLDVRLPDGSGIDLCRTIRSAHPDIRCLMLTAYGDDQALMGADMDTQWAPNVDKPKNGFDVTLHTTDKAEGQRWFDRLAEGGKAVMPFSETFWSPGFGSLVDKFGVPWMINVIPPADWKPSQG